MTASPRARRSRSRISRMPLAGVAALGLLALSACGSGDDAGGGGGEGGGLDVVASFYPMEFLAERIGGDHVSVSTLTEPGVEPHDLDLSPRETARLSEADLVVYLRGLQPAVDEAVEQSGVAHVAEATSFTTLETHGDEVDGEEHAEDEHAEDEHAEDEHAEEGHAEEGDGHDHEGGDPHIWLDPVRYAEVAQGVGEALAEADPDNAADYERNAEQLVGELQALDDEFAAGLADVPNRTFITTHAAFGYLAERYELREEAITGLDPESEPSAARMRDLQEIAREDGVTTVFFETLVSDETARTLADDLGLETAVLDPVEGITDDSPGADYLEVMRANLAALQQALGAR
ncbi:metal ABC transporter substrate-binding protein [Streptomyces sp. 8K308]|uniref:metal ABC transporter substrate-binding protein n=1 Tax=Streptomyces sp. 8K308 TaxID=2530388 RepID=UPI001FB5F18B|nr:metal ABC transporter substrate-binding protein [Streptomyces sp. 8K308]